MNSLEELVLDDTSCKYHFKVNNISFELNDICYENHQEVQTLTNEFKQIALIRESAFYTSSHLFKFKIDNIISLNYNNNRLCHSTRNNIETLLPIVNVCEKVDVTVNSLSKDRSAWLPDHFKDCFCILSLTDPFISFHIFPDP